VGSQQENDVIFKDIINKFLEYLNLMMPLALAPTFHYLYL
jgi:hypothetical protein